MKMDPLNGYLCLASNQRANASNQILGSTNKAVSLLIGIGIDTVLDDLISMVGGKLFTTTFNGKERLSAKNIYGENIWSYWERMNLTMQCNSKSSIWVLRLNDTKRVKVLNVIDKIKSDIYSKSRITIGDMDKYFIELKRLQLGVVVQPRFEIDGASTSGGTYDDTRGGAASVMSTRTLDETIDDGSESDDDESYMSMVSNNTLVEEDINITELGDEDNEFLNDRNNIF